MMSIELTNDGLIGYQYVTLRLVPNIEREEFVNVGVVVYAQMANYLAAATHLDATRVQALCPDLNCHQVDSALTELCQTVHGGHHPSRPHFDNLGHRFGWVAAPRSTIIQPGPRHGGVTLDPAATLNALMRRLVLVC